MIGGIMVVIRNDDKIDFFLEINIRDRLNAIITTIDDRC